MGNPQIMEQGERYDVYGFLMGDEMLMLTSRVLSKWSDRPPEGKNALPR
jgi:hypothetical protein